MPKECLGKIKKVAEGNNEEVEVDLLPIKNFYIWKEACVSGFKLMDKDVKLQENLDCSCSGTTAGEDLVIANLGDLRAVLGIINENGIMPNQLTTDLKPAAPTDSEQAAAKALVEFAVATWKKLPCSKVHDCTAVCPCLHKRQR
ncbi:hypothetical protein GH714_013007 [Hevea brasiliensis]|uniref:Uncharacterized protein n=1 Tax=Hevea brasiliensis TaxID=3981 RepID=A0A6A6KBI0_HEVBR|nr:hypothetical protein GH714_013007 [Hevea brasiliensis]